MRRTPHLQLRGAVWHWRRRQPRRGAFTGGRILTLSLATGERSLARARAAALDAVFEEFMRKTTTGDIDDNLFARIMLEARDIIIAQMHHEDAVRPPPAPRRPSQVITVPKAALSDVERLEEIAANAPDTPASQDGHVLATAPGDDVTNLLAALDAAPRDPSRPSRRRAAQGLADILAGKLALLEEDLCLGEHAAVRDIMPEVLRRVGVEADGPALFVAERAAMQGYIEALRRTHDLRRGAFPSTHEHLQEAAASQAARRPPPPDSGLQRQPMPAHTPSHEEAASTTGPDDWGTSNNAYQTSTLQRAPKASTLVAPYLSVSDSELSRNVRGAEVGR